MGNKVDTDPKIVIPFYKLHGITLSAEHVFHPTRKWRLDFVDISHRISIEVQGGLFSNGGHSRGAGYIQDMEKHNAATLLGWSVYKCTPAGLYTQSFIDLIKKAITVYK